MDQAPGRVRRHSAPVAGMQRGVRSAGAQLEGDHAAHAEDYRGPARLVHRAVAPHPEVGTARRVRGEPPADGGGQVRAADLLLAVQHERDPARQGTGSPGLMQRAQRQELGEVLALVVAGAPAVHPAVPDVGFERGSVPVAGRAGRLHVIVPVDEHVRRVRRPVRSPENQRMTAGLDHFRGQAAPPDQIRRVAGGGGETRPVAAHARLPDPVRPFPDKLLASQGNPLPDARQHGLAVDLGHDGTLPIPRHLSHDVRLATNCILKSVVVHRACMVAFQSPAGILIRAARRS